jgi:protoporphyrinogen oxidase
LIVIGGGPAGLTAAIAATKRGLRPLVLEADHCVGGISRTETYRGYGFDMGGHRFFTKSKEVEALWYEILGDDFLTRPRLSRIFYNGKFYSYPLKPLDALRNLGLYESSFLIGSYFRWKVFPHKKEENFEEWVVNRFGRRLFRTFFKTYTEKVWGVSTRELRADWAAQRIKDLSLKRAVLGGIIKPQHGKIKTLIERFQYPRRGPGQLWEAAADLIESRGGEVRLNAPVKALHREGDTITGVETASGETFTAANYVSTLPLTVLVKQLKPATPLAVREAALSLRYRDYLTVCLIVDEPEPFPDNWVYVHDASVKVGRVQNYKNWSEHMVPEEDRATRTALGMEYFCNVGDELWQLDDEQLVELATNEIETIGLIPQGKVVDGVVYRVPKSYPVYDEHYAGHVEKIRQHVDGYANMVTIGRNGLHRYNNQDHSMLTALRAIENLYDGDAHDVWSINADQEYHEESKEGKRGPGRNTPQPAASR